MLSTGVSLCRMVLQHMRFEPNLSWLQHQAMKISMMLWQAFAIDCRSNLHLCFMGRRGP